MAMPVPSKRESKTIGAGRLGAKNGQSRAAALVRAMSACAAQGRNSKPRPRRNRTPATTQFSTACSARA
eukprot:4057712-Lingulodinium_polyedra.AAC.1